MAEIINATFQDGAFVPERMPEIPAGTRVRLTVEEVAPTDTRQPEQLSPFAKACEQHPINSGLRMTRDQLHERD